MFTLLSLRGHICLQSHIHFQLFRVHLHFFCLEAEQNNENANMTYDSESKTAFLRKSNSVTSSVYSQDAPVSQKDSF